ncbi:hypothetical protein [Blastopirellula marina]|uniref:hypothetical protein n=1 Tax=Blastopirellula marina TaxID=124 RepID=UPI0011B07981|nr:hypothetical protein [Blastopirellula marina]
MMMECLRCQTPAMVRKEIHCRLIGYNIVRAAMIASALKFQRCRNRLSFTGALQAVDQFAAYLRRRSVAVIVNSGNACCKRSLS